MECPRCHYENAGGARFCGECGASLTRDVTCSSCGHANPAGQTFCNGCGGRLDESLRSAARDRRAYTPKHLAEKILTSRTALEGERKQVTVLFADVKGSMELAEQVDPEVWHRIMDRFFRGRAARHPHAARWRAPQPQAGVAQDSDRAGRAAAPARPDPAGCGRGGLVQPGRPAPHDHPPADKARGRRVISVTSRVLRGWREDDVMALRHTAPPGGREPAAVPRRLSNG